MTQATPKPAATPAKAQDEGDEEYTTTNPMAMGREPTFTLEDNLVGVQAQPQVAPLASNLTHLSDRVLTDDEQAQLDAAKK
jgi:hypothetical protein